MKGNNNHKKTLLITLFIATSLVLSGCDFQEITEDNQSEANQEKSSPQMLKDSNGHDYTLIDNGDGTETISYPDGRNVTIQRDDEDNIQYRSGDSSLIPTFLLTYLLYHSLQPTPGFYDAGSNTYRFNSRPARLTEEHRKAAISPYIPVGSKLRTTPTSKPGTVKSGFGHAGVRSSATS